MRLVERSVQVSDDPLVRLFVAETSGDPARTLLVVHGGPDWDHTYLRDPLVRLSDRHRVVFVDLRGCGRSTRSLPAAEHTPAAAVQDLVTLVDDLGSLPVDVLGFSYGGQLVQRLVVAAPERVRRAVIASSSILPVPADAFDGWKERDERLTADWTTTGFSDDGYDEDERTRLDAVRSAALNVWRLDELEGYLARLADIRFSSDWSQAWPDHSLMPPARPDNVVERLRRLGTPLLLLHGRHDMTYPAALVEPTLALILNARGVVLDEAGHMAHVDQPEAWLTAISDFLEAAGT